MTYQYVSSDGAVCNIFLHKVTLCCLESVSFYLRCCETAQRRLAGTEEEEYVAALTILA